VEDRLKRQMDFMMEIDKMKEIGRQTYLADGSRKENDAEHSWSLAMMCMLFAEYANEDIDVLHTMEMVLVHDLVEIDAGDTYAYDEKGNSTKRERELAAADRIFHILPEDQAQFIRNLWDEFEAGETPEAKFANAVDKVQPITLNDKSGGKAWEEHKVKAEQVVKRNGKTSEGSKELWKYCEGLIQKNLSLGKLK
jgi:putative hydrolase of HD superfamily